MSDCASDINSTAVLSHVHFWHVHSILLRGNLYKDMLTFLQFMYILEYRAGSFQGSPVQTKCYNPQKWTCVANFYFCFKLIIIHYHSHNRI